MSTFGERLKCLRKQNKLTQQQLANNFYLDKSSISKYESGKNIPENDLLQKIADYFNVTVDYLLGRSDISNTETRPLNIKEKLDIEKEAEKMIDSLDKLETVEFCGTPADDEDKEFLKIAYERFLTDVRIYNKQKYTPKKYK